MEHRKNHLLPEHVNMQTTCQQLQSLEAKLVESNENQKKLSRRSCKQAKVVEKATRRSPRMDAASIQPL